MPTREDPVQPVPPAEGLPDALARAVGDSARVLTRPLDVVAYASDASVYRLVPRAVVQPRSEAEIQALFALSHARNVPMTFRAAGTSLSGQAVTDGILVDVSKHWSRIEVLDEGRRVRVQPGAIGGHVNARLRARGRRIGPDPASIDSCMMGGILANNASGMCCGVRENAYHTLDSLRFVLPSGLVVDTASPDAGELLRQREPALFQGLLSLGRRIEGDARLAARIREKYRIKNTTGYGLNAFLDFDRPEQFLAHLLIGSEGTLAFISEAVLHTLPEYRVKRTGLLLFRGAADAFAAVAPLERSGARAIEFMDDACLRTVDAPPGLGVDLRALPPGAAALLVEYQCETEEELAVLREAEAELLARLELLSPARFTEDAGERAALWKVRKGLFPAVGATKRSGEAVIIEDVAFPLPRLTAATAELKALFAEHGYGGAILFGHAKDGNCHFVITQSFNDARETARYERFMAAVVALVVRHDGSLKAEHGTGRNMAPFVEAEWGRDAVTLMRELKALVDPRGLLNPGVLLNDDPRAHVMHLKSLPTVEQEVDRCIECGFCEPVCPSRSLTLTPRQRIAVRREMARLRTHGGDDAALASLHGDFQYAGLDTCAADGLCATACPVKIDTGGLVKRLRGEQHSARARAVARWVAGRFGLFERMARWGVRTGHVAERLLGAGRLRALSRFAERLVGARLPGWSDAIPRVPRRALPSGGPRDAEAVYVPACLSRIMGQPRTQQRSLSEVLLLLAERAGARVWVPDGCQGQCCGLPFGSKGFTEAHALMLERLVERLWAWSDEGRRPIVLDATSCLQSMKASAGLLQGEAKRRLLALRLVDAMEFVRDTLLPRLQVHRLERRVVLHPTCAARKLDLVDTMRGVAERCATHVEVPLSLGCCAMAGDRGLLHPELTGSAVAPERAEVLAGAFEGHYSSNLTCEVGMTQATGVAYTSLLYLVEEATRPGR
nr:FAD-binding and (Fe-S)-binding domain-containing protein [Myxococcus sp. RHSTA-1-4]